LFKKKQVLIILSIAVMSFLLGTSFHNLTIARIWWGEYDPWYEVAQDITNLEKRVESLESRTPNKGFISISPSAFQPDDITLSTYRTNGSHFSGEGRFIASLQLPHRAIITNMTISADDWTTDGAVYVLMLRSEVTGEWSGSWFVMASVYTGWEDTPGYIVLYDDTIDYAEIDNQNYYYWLVLDISPFYSCMLYGALIEYEYLT
jgi:hypothetical protein